MISSASVAGRIERLPESKQANVAVANAKNGQPAAGHQFGRNHRQIPADQNNTANPTPMPKRKSRSPHGSAVAGLQPRSPEMRRDESQCQRNEIAKASGTQNKPKPGKHIKQNAVQTGSRAER